MSNLTNPWRRYNYVNVLGNSEQLCWSCKNFARCDWSKGIPIEGWTAIETKMNVGYNKREITNYMILDCPQFEKDR